jgi:hypothetical protein
MRETAVSRIFAASRSLVRGGFRFFECPTSYCTVEEAAVVDAVSEEVAVSPSPVVEVAVVDALAVGAIEGAAVGSMMTVLVEVEVRPA